MKKFKELSIEKTKQTTGGGIDFTGLGSLFGPVYKPWEAINKMNGKTNRPKPSSCSPYGTGGTPNSCNF